MAPFYMFWVLSALALVTTAQEARHLEIDVIYPRNETYFATDALPIVLAIQNATAVNIGRKCYIHWYIMPYSGGSIPEGVVVDSKSLPVPEGAAEPAIFVFTANVTAWLGRMERRDRYYLSWGIDWEGLQYACPWSPHISGGVMFGLEARSAVDGNASWWYDGGKVTEPDIMQATGCPSVGGVFDFTPLATATASACPTVAVRTDKPGDPCAVKVDASVLSSISSQVSSLAKPTPTPTPTISWHIPSKSNAAAEMDTRVPMRLAAACLLGSFAFASC